MAHSHVPIHTLWHEPSSDETTRLVSLTTIECQYAVNGNFFDTRHRLELSFALMQGPGP